MVLFTFIIIVYGLWGGCSNINLQGCFQLQKTKQKTIRIISKLRFRDTCRDSFRDLDLLTLPSLYVYINETVIYGMLQCKVTRGMDVHECNTRRRQALRTTQDCLRAVEALPYEVGANSLQTTTQPTK